MSVGTSEHHRRRVVDTHQGNMQESNDLCIIYCSSDLVAPVKSVRLFQSEDLLFGSETSKKTEIDKAACHDQQSM